MCTNNNTIFEQLHRYTVVCTHSKARKGGGGKNTRTWQYVILCYLSALPSGNIYLHYLSGGLLVATTSDKLFPTPITNQLPILAIPSTKNTLHTILREERNHFSLLLILFPSFSSSFVTVTLAPSVPCSSSLSSFFLVCPPLLSFSSSRLIYHFDWHRATL